MNNRKRSSRDDEEISLSSKSEDNITVFEALSLHSESNTNWIDDENKPVYRRWKISRISSSEDKNENEGNGITKNLLKKVMILVTTKQPIMILLIIFFV